MTDCCPDDGYDLTVRRGNNVPVAWVFKNADGTLFPLAGSVFNLNVTVFGQDLMSFTTGVDANFVLDTVTASVTWTPTVEESATVPLGRQAQYGLDRLIDDTVRTLSFGYMIGVGND